MTTHADVTSCLRSTFSAPFFQRLSAPKIWPASPVRSNFSNEAASDSDYGHVHVPLRPVPDSTVLSPALEPGSLRGYLGARSHPRSSEGLRPLHQTATGTVGWNPRHRPSKSESSQTTSTTDSLTDSHGLPFNSPSTTMSSLSDRNTDLSKNVAPGSSDVYLDWKSLPSSLVFAAMESLTLPPILTGGGTWDVYRIAGSSRHPGLICKICVPDTFPLEPARNTQNTWASAAHVRAAVDRESQCLGQLQGTGLCPSFAGLWKAEIDISSTESWEVFMIILEDLGDVLRDSDTWSVFPLQER